MSTLELTAEEDVPRLDAWLAMRLEGYSRSRIQDFIRDGLVLVDGQPGKANRKLTSGQVVSVRIPEEPSDVPQPEEIPLDILYEDDDLLVLNKPAGLVIHPAPGHPHGTLVNALLHYVPSLRDVESERPGIVHRLDRDTSGVMVAAKSEEMTRELIRVFKNRQVEKEYLALTNGVPDPAEGTIETEIGRDPNNRKRMSTRPDQGKHAITHYRVLEEREGTAFVHCRIETGRTHQIRVHMAHLGTPVLGDTVYGGTRRLNQRIPAVERQLLHAAKLEFEHPGTGKRIAINADLPEDMRYVMLPLGYTCLS